MRSIAELSSRITGQSFTKKYVALGRVLSAWEDIIGTDLAGKVQPVKIHYRKSPKGAPPNICLDIAVAGAEATLLHYQKDLILERINRIFGDNWITALKFVPAETKSPRRARMKNTPIPLTHEQKNHLSQVLEPVSDPDLKTSLEQIGQAILKESQTS